MHNTITNLIYIEELIKSKVNHDKLPKIIAVSKTFPIENILPLIEHGHIHYGENKVQEALNKWTEIKNQNNMIKLHLIGKLQTNKVKLALKVFDYIHSLDSEKLATKISEEQAKQGKKPKVFIQVNIGNEEQKSGIPKKKFLAWREPIATRLLHCQPFMLCGVPKTDMEATLELAPLLERVIPGKKCSRSPYFVVCTI